MSSLHWQQTGTEAGRGGGRWGLTWMRVVLCFKTCKEAVEVVERRDVAVAELRRRFIVCDGLNALPRTPCVPAVFNTAELLQCLSACDVLFKHTLLIL